MVRRGGSLVEVAVALVLFGGGLGAIASAATAALRLSNRAHVTTLAVAFAGALVDSLANLATIRADSSETDLGRFAWSAHPAGESVVRVELRLVIAGSRDTLVFPFLAGPPPGGID